MSLIREDDVGPYIILDSTIYRPSPLMKSLAVAGDKVTAERTGRVRFSNHVQVTLGLPVPEEKWTAHESVKAYKDARSQDKLWPSWRDFLGNTYEPGDYVVYAAMYGQSACLKFGKVIRINRYASSGKPHMVFDSATKKRVPGATVTIEVIENSGTSYTPHNRNTTILDTSKIVKVEGTYMQKFEALETELVDAELERIKEKYS